MQEKLKGRKIVAPHEEARPKGANVVDLMEALKRSIGQQQASGGGKKAEKASKTPAKTKTSRAKKSA